MKNRYSLLVFVVALTLLGLVSCAGESRRVEIKDQSIIEGQCSDQKLVEDVEECSLALQSHFSFNAYVSGDCKIHVKGDPQRRNRSYAEFDGCLSSKGRPIMSWERE